MALDLQTSTMVSRVKKRFGKADSWPLHWKRLKKHQHKVFICSEFLTEDFIFTSVAVDKVHARITQAPKLKQKWYLYFYATRFLLERVSWYVRDTTGGVANLIFEHRSNMSYDAMKEYFDLLQGWIPPTEIAWNHLNVDGLQIEAKGTKRLLQACDALCGTLQDALEWDNYGQIEPRYVLTASSKFYRRGSNLFSYGLKFLHATSGTAALKQLKAEYDWLEKM